MKGYAEVVSQMEYHLAIRIGVPPKRIIFNGPLKLAQDIENAIMAGSIVNLESHYEVSIVKALAQKLPGHDIIVGVRCNFDIGTGSLSRFGFDVQKGELDIVFETLDRLKNCRIAGLHCHFSTSERSTESYALRARKMLDISLLYFKDYNPRFIDLGGGFFGKLSEDLKKQFDCPAPSYQEYAEAIAPYFADAFPDGSGPELILEPGAAIVADVMKFVAKVVYVKSLRSHKLAITTGSIHNIMPTQHDKNLPLRVYGDDKNKNRKEIIGPIDIVGYTCMEDDCLYKAYDANIAEGDYAVFDNVGAYTIVLKPPFIRSNPAIISYDSLTDRYELIKRREEFKDMFCTYSTGK